MSMQKGTKINLLQDLLEEGLLAPTWWLEAQGYSRALLSKYVASGWLTAPARGVYRRPGPPLKWQHVVASLQLLGGSFFHVGGRTALVQHGLGHYVRMSGAETIYLYGPETLPGWVNSLGLQEQFVARSDAMFSALRARRGEQGTALDLHDRPVAPEQLADFGLREETWGAWDWRLWYASDERAMFEVLQDVPARESIHEADVLMQGLANLRPARVMVLLMACTSVKVKRLFLALAERHQHAWFSRLDVSKVELGKGKRMLVPGGKLHPKYLITLPVDMETQISGVWVKEDDAMKNTDDLLIIGQRLKVSRATLQELVQRYHIRRLALFGSAARDELKPDSDIDLMVEFEPGAAPSLWAAQDLQQDFVRLFDGRQVDIAPPEILRNPYRRKTIERDLKVLYEAA